MVLKTQPERIATIRRMAALPGSGVRPDQVFAIAQAFEKLIGDGDRDGAYKNMTYRRCSRADSQRVDVDKEQYNAQGERLIPGGHAAIC